MRDAMKIMARQYKMMLNYAIDINRVTSVSGNDSHVGLTHSSCGINWICNIGIEYIEHRDLNNAIILQ